MQLKGVRFHGKAREIIKGFPDSIKKDLGKYILDLQKGETLLFPNSRPMPVIAKGVSEVRVKDANGIYRVFYMTKLKNVILVFHAFQKKDQKTPKREIELAKQRLKEIIEKIGI